MTKFIIGVLMTIFLMNFSTINGQSIRSLKSDIHSSYVPKYGSIEKVINTNTFYSKSGVEKKKDVYEYSTKMDTITEKRYESSEITAELTFIFNQNKQLTSRSFKRKIPYSGWKYDLATYKYDSTGLIERTEFDSNGNKVINAVIKNDSLSNIIELRLFDKDNELIGYETATYDYPSNNWVYRVFDKTGNLVTTNNYEIDLSINTDRKYNEQGDCIYYPRNWGENDDVYFELQIKYDKKGNWVQKKIYEVKLNGNRVVDRSINRIFKRKIVYKNN
ncbi:hypothetical protein [Roseivirga pacifica]|uniref:hypothetical protein n=1 Tax=Roseivirga pacifica TaxID=1267423 RepID=UPI00227A5B37|nr:hypothetical protein [Roseivirga pacifica]